MSVLEIWGGRPLNGSVTVQGAKNSVLPILAAALLTPGETVIRRVPDLTDVDAAAAILRWLGCRVDREPGLIAVDARRVTRCDIPEELMRRMRSSVVFLGAVLARCGEARMTLPGGCELGPRPIDLHLAALEALGASTDQRAGQLTGKTGEVKGGRVELPFPSVGATENAMLLASRAPGETVIVNAACEPEIRDLGEFLTAMGCPVSGAGTPTVRLGGASAWRDHTDYAVIPDRIAAATYLAACASAGGDVAVKGVRPRDLTAVTDVFREMGCDLRTGAGEIRMKAGKPLRAPRPITTRPFPGFPTDAQPPVLAACLTAEGTTVFRETIFEMRFRHLPALRRMGAEVEADGETARVTGVRRLHGASVEAQDLRGGAALCVAALAAEGKTAVRGLKHLDRGYEGLDTALRGLGADVTRRERD